MLRAVPRNVSSWDYDLIENRERVATVRVPWLGEGGSFKLGGDSFEIRSQGFLGDTVLSRGRRVICRAKKPSAFFSRLNIEYAGRRMTLEAESSLRRAFVLREGKDLVGRIRPSGTTSRAAEVDLPESLPLEVRIFALCLVVTVWRQESAAGNA